MIHRIKHSLLGVADHQGVENVGGRVGSALGPRSFRSIWEKFPISPSMRENFDDHGDLQCQADERLSEFHSRVEMHVSQIALKKNRMVLVGGGHDFAAPLICGISRANPGKKIGCINFDAHFDLRSCTEESITSGSPFYLLIEKKVIDGNHLVEFGIQNQSNSEALFEYAAQKKVRTLTLPLLQKKDVKKVFLDELKKLTKCVDFIVISLDLDVFSQADAPGVSAPQAEGLSVSAVFEMLKESAANPKVCALGIFELNPLHDIDQKTARLAATAAYRWIYSK